MTVRTFGRKGDVQGDRQMAQRLEAFVAAERERKQMATAPHGARAAIAMASASTPVRGERSLAVAYLFWFFLGGLSGHRFYLGYPVSAALLAGLWLVSLVMLLGGFAGALLTLGIAGLWLLSDAFFIPGMHRRAVERRREIDRACADASA